MIYKKSHLYSFVVVIFLISTVQIVNAQQSTMQVASRFLKYLNNYQSDRLDQILADDFLLSRTYTEFSQDKAAFISKYIPESKAYNGKFVVLDSAHKADTAMFLVEDHSDYLKYLGIAYPRWQLRIIVGSKKLIESLTIDTTLDYRNYRQSIIKEEKLFDQWFKGAYPNDNRDSLNKDPQLELQRLREYADKN